MGLCHSIESYDSYNRYQVKHGNKYLPKTTRGERKAAKKALRKYQRTCAKLAISEGLVDVENEVQQKAQEMVQLAHDVRWGIEDIIAMYDDFGLDPRVVALARADYETFMLDEDIY